MYLNARKMILTVCCGMDSFVTMDLRLHITGTESWRLFVCFCCRGQHTLDESDKYVIEKSSINSDKCNNFYRNGKRIGS
jgi:hypothetical protein